ncbi:MAG: tRNA (adenosine(37)-N6)-threonylcarbamoyltransferase complex dimerization subunit type 1 TsaB [Halieaceae bacterium]
MLNILALDTSTDACSVCLRRGDELLLRQELIPRQHNQRLFSMLREVLPEGPFEQAGIDLLAWAQGPGSFTGLRIAASAVQGLAYSNALPVVGVSTLACLAQGALRRGLVGQRDLVLVLLDARINEVYCGLYRFEAGLAVAVVDDCVCAPAEVDEKLLKDAPRVVALGSGLSYLADLPVPVRAKIERAEPEQWPDSQDLLPLAEHRFSQGQAQLAAAVQPVYLRNEISWKKLSEQG